MKGRTLFSLDEAAAELQISPSDLLDLAHQGRANVVVASYGLVVEYDAYPMLPSADFRRTTEIIRDRFRSPSRSDLGELLIANLSNSNHRITGLQPTDAERQRFAKELGCKDSELYLSVDINGLGDEYLKKWPFETALLVTGEEVARLQPPSKNTGLTKTDKLDDLLIKIIQGIESSTASKVMKEIIAELNRPKHRIYDTTKLLLEKGDFGKSFKWRRQLANGTSEKKCTFRNLENRLSKLRNKGLI